MGPPRFVGARFLSTTMTSADFLAHRKRIYSKISPGKGIFLPPISTGSTRQTPDGLFPHPLDVSMSGCLILSDRPLYPVPVRWNQGLQSRFLHSMLHSNRACDSLMLRDTNSRAQGTFTLRNILVSSIPDAHAGHTTKPKLHLNAV